MPRPAFAGRFIIRALSPRAWDKGLSRTGTGGAGRYRLSQPGDKIHKGARVLDSATPDEFLLPPAGAMESGGHCTRLSRGPANTGDLNLQLENHVDRMMLHDQKHYLPDDILTRSIRAAMAVSLETCLPRPSRRRIRVAPGPSSSRSRGGAGKDPAS